jgi:hypothetical protein
MSKTYDPNAFAHELSTTQRQWTQSVQQVVNGGIDMGTPVGNAPASAGVNAGVYTQFNRGNGSGVLIRIAATGVTDTGANYNWVSNNTGLKINHGLLRQPIGFHVVDQDKNASVYRTVSPDENQITLATTDATASHTVYVF